MNGFRAVKLDSFRQLCSEFLEMLVSDISEMKDGDYIYAFLNNDMYGTNGNYTKIKILKMDNSGYLFILDDGDEMLSVDIFATDENDDYPVGYCTSLEDAEAIKILRTKKVIDSYCRYIGYADMREFIDIFKKYKDEYPEKLV